MLAFALAVTVSAQPGGGFQRQTPEQRVAAIHFKLDSAFKIAPDKLTILDSVRKTGRVVIADTANKTCSAASEISSIIAEEAFFSLKAPIGIVAHEDVPVPFAKNLELLLLPTKEKLLAKVIATVNQSKNN